MGRWRLQVTHVKGRLMGKRRVGFEIESLLRSIGKCMSLVVLGLWILWVLFKGLCHCHWRSHHGVNGSHENGLEGPRLLVVRPLQVGPEKEKEPAVVEGFL